MVVPPQLDLVRAAPLGCGFQTGAGAIANVLRPSETDSVVVFGVGGVGIAGVMAGAALGASTIVAVELTEDRRTLALQLGATHAVDGNAPNVVEQIIELTDGGANGALDTTGVPQVIRSAALALAPRGSLVVVGIGQPDVELNVGDLVSSGKSVRGSIEGDTDPHTFIPTMLDWMSRGSFPVEKVVAAFPFEQINDAVAASRSTALKAVLEF